MAENDDLQLTRTPARNGGWFQPVRTSEQARSLATRRWNRVRAAARSGVDDASRQMPDLPVPGADAMTAEERERLIAQMSSSDRQSLAVRRAFEQHTLNACDPSARGSTASLRAVMDYAYAPDYAEKRAGDGGPVPDGARLEMDAVTARELLALLRAVVESRR